MSFARKAIFVSGGQMLNVFMSMVAGILFSRALGPAGMGKYETFRSTALMAIMIATLGFGSANIYFLNNQNVSVAAIVNNAIRISAVLGVALSLVLCTLFLALPGFFGEVPIYVAAIFALSAGAQVGPLIMLPILTAGLQVRRMVWVDLVRPIALLGGGAILVGMGQLRADTGILLQAAGFFAGLVMVLYFLRDHIDLRRKFDVRLFTGVLSYGIKLGIAGMLMTVTSNLAVLLLRALRPEQFDDVGLYTRALAVCSLVVLVPYTLGPLLYARWSKASGAEKRAEVEMAFRLNITYGVSIAIVLALFGKYVIWILYGAKFILAQQALAILAPALIFLPIFSVSDSLLASEGRAIMSAYVLSASLVLVCCSGLLLIPRWGIQGAAASALIANLFTGTAGMMICRRLFGIRLRRCLVVHRGDLAYLFGRLIGPSAADVADKQATREDAS